MELEAQPGVWVRTVQGWQRAVARLWQGDGAGRGGLSSGSAPKTTWGSGSGTGAVLSARAAFLKVYDFTRES